MRDRLPPSVLAALGLLSSCQSCDPPTHPCLSVVETQPPPDTIPEVPPKDPPPDGPVGPCLEPPPLSACLSVAPDEPPPTVAPCLKPHHDPSMQPCLSIRLPHKCLSAIRPPRDPAVAPCLSEAPIEEHLTPCLDVDSPSGQLEPSPGGPSRVARRVLARDVLPADVQERIRRRDQG